MDETLPAHRVGAYLRLMRLHQPVGALLLLWPTLAALWMAAEGLPPLDVLAIFVVGTVLARTAGCVANDIADRRFDGHVRRTRNRPLPAGELTVLQALCTLLALALACFALVLGLNPLARMLAVAGAGTALLYPLLKRWTHWPQAVLGIAFSWGVPMAFAAAQGRVPPTAWLLFAASALWVVAYDTIYAMVDRDDDLKIGVKSTAILLGGADRAAIAVLQLATLCLLLWLGGRLGFQHAYYAGLATVLGLFVHQQRLIRHQRAESCLRAFRNNVWVGFALFAGTVGEYWLAS